jgi:hypothetical protein
MLFEEYGFRPVEHHAPRSANALRPERSFADCAESWLFNIDHTSWSPAQAVLPHISAHVRLLQIFRAAMSEETRPSGKR